MILADNPKFEASQLKSPISDDHWRVIHDELSKQNDRGVAIIGASLVDEHLRFALESKFLPDLSENRKSWIFNGNGPLATYSAKVEVGYALGLYSETLRLELRLLGQIRNKFAHSFEAIDFTHSEIVELCKGLNAEDEKLRAETNSRNKYLFACFLAMGVLFAMGNAKAYKKEISK